MKDQPNRRVVLEGGFGLKGQTDLLGIQPYFQIGAIPGAGCCDGRDSNCNDYGSDLLYC